MSKEEISTKKKYIFLYFQIQIQINFTFFLLLCLSPHLTNPYKINQTNQLNRIEYNAILLQKQFNHHNVLVENSIN